MDDGFGTLLGIAGLVVPLILEQYKSNQRSREEMRQAVKSLKDALILTEGYLNNLKRLDGDDYRKSQHRDRSKEIELARAWSRASLDCRGIYQHLGEMADMKSRFWQSTELWSRSKVTSARISISDARERIEELESKLG